MRPDEQHREESEHGRARRRPQARPRRIANSPQRLPRERRGEEHRQREADQARLRERLEIGVAGVVGPAPEAAPVLGQEVRELPGEGPDPGALDGVAGEEPRGALPEQRPRRDAEVQRDPLVEDGAEPRGDSPGLRREVRERHAADQEDGRGEDGDPQAPDDAPRREQDDEAEPGERQAAARAREREPGRERHKGE